MNGSIDFIIYDKILEKYTIYDIKTSTKGWSPNHEVLFKKLLKQGGQFKINGVLVAVTPEEKPQVTTDKEIEKIAGDIDTGKSSELNKAINVIKNVTDKLQNMKSGSKEYNDKMIALRQYIGKNKNLLRGQDISLLTKKLIGGGEI